MTTASIPRLHRLRPWLVRALIPEGLTGTYVLFKDGEAEYIGRSDSCLRRRLLVHAYRRRAHYFRYEVHNHAVDSFGMECALFHAPPGARLSNRLHPASPQGSAARCPFCAGAVERARAVRHKE